MQFFTTFFISALFFCVSCSPQPNKYNAKPTWNVQLSNAPGGTCDQVTCTLASSDKLYDYVCSYSFSKINNLGLEELTNEIFYYQHSPLGIENDLLLVTMDGKPSGTIIHQEFYVENNFTIKKATVKRGDQILEITCETLELHLTDEQKKAVRKVCNNEIMQEVSCKDEISRCQLVH